MCVDRQDVVDLAITRLEHGERNYRLCYALRMIHPSSGQLHWLQDDWLIGRCRQQLESSHPGDEWRYCTGGVSATGNLTRSQAVAGIGRPYQ